MKQLLLSILLAGTVGSAIAQQPCTPDPLYADSLFGVWPDTTDNFVWGAVGEPYLQILNLLVPEDAGVIDPLLAGTMLDSVAFNGITGLPPGLSVACNSQTPANCTYLTGVLGCGVIQGTPTQAGTFNLTLNVTAYTYTEIFGNPVVLPIPYSFSGYTINISESVGVAELGAPALSGVRNVPNPFATRTHIEFQLGKASEVRVRIFNLLGDELWSQYLQGRQGANRVSFESGALPEGVYLFKVETGKETFTGRMVLSR